MHGRRDHTLPRIVTRCSAQALTVGLVRVVAERTYDKGLIGSLIPDPGHYHRVSDAHYSVSERTCPVFVSQRLAALSTCLHY